jgi:ABC-type sugar transport system ATPase subunit
VRGEAVTIDSPGRAVELGIAYVPEDRRRHGVILEMSVAANTTLAILRKIAVSEWLDRFYRERRIAQDFVSPLASKRRRRDPRRQSLRRQSAEGRPGPLAGDRAGGHHSR